MRTQEQRLLNISGYQGYQEVLIPSAGTRIALSVYESQKGDPCVVFIPGTMTHPLFYDDFLCPLAEHGFNVVGVHLLSHGKSPREKEVFTLDDMVANVQDTMTWCIENVHDNVFLMGSSQGGILSMAVAGKDARVRAVFPHNILLPDLADSIVVTRYPQFLKPLHTFMQKVFLIGAKVLPRLQIPIMSYLDPDRITKSKHIMDQFYADPLGRTSYPLAFMASLFSADLSMVTDGSITCPVVVIASQGDLLFPYDYTLQVFQRIAAPKKEMLLFDEPYHLIFQECIDRIIGPIVDKLKEYA